MVSSIPQMAKSTFTGSALWMVSNQALLIISEASIKRYAEKEGLNSNNQWPTDDL